MRTALNHTVVLALDVALPDLNPLLGTLDLGPISCAVAVIEPNLEEQTLVMSSADPFPYTFDTNGTAVQMSAKLRCKHAVSLV